MGLPRVRFTLWRMMIVVGAATVGLAIAPAGYPYLAIFTPLAAGYALLDPDPLFVPALFVLACSVFLEFLLCFPVPLWVYLPVAIALKGPYGIAPVSRTRPGPTRRWSPSAP